MTITATGLPGKPNRMAWWPSVLSPLTPTLSPPGRGGEVAPAPTRLPRESTLTRLSLESALTRPMAIGRPGRIAMRQNSTSPTFAITCFV